MLKKIITMGLFLACTGTQAQGDVEEVIVTGLMEADGYYEMPAVTLKKQGDFLVQSVKIMNDSRDKALREKELRQTLQALSDIAKSKGNIQLSYGDEFLRTLDPQDKSLVFPKDGSRADTSIFYFSVKQKIDPNMPASQQEAFSEIHQIG